MTGVSEAVNEHLVEENRRLREALRDAREVADLLRKQAAHHNDMAQEVRQLRREMQNLLSVATMGGGSGPVGPMGPKGEKGDPFNYEDYEVDNLGNLKPKGYQQKVKEYKQKTNKSF